MSIKKIYYKSGNIIEERNYKFYDEYEEYVEKEKDEQAEIVARLKKKTGGPVGIYFVEPHSFNHWLYLKFKKEGTAKC